MIKNRNFEICVLATLSKVVYHSLTTDITTIVIILPRSRHKLVWETSNCKSGVIVFKLVPLLYRVTCSTRKLIVASQTVNPLHGSRSSFFVTLLKEMLKGYMMTTPNDVIMFTYWINLHIAQVYADSFWISPLTNLASTPSLFQCRLNTFTIIIKYVIEHQHVGVHFF